MTDPVRQRVRLAGTVTAVVVVTAWLFSAGPSVQSIQTFGAQINNVPPPTGEFVDNLRRSAQLFSASTGPITVLNSDVPFALVPPAYGPYNRADWVAELNDIPLDFDQLDRPTYAISDDGTLTPASIDWRYELAVSTGTEPGLTIAGANDLHSESGGGVCFQATSSTNLGWVLPAPVSGERIVVRSLVTVDAPTVQRLVVLPSDSQSYEVANYDKKAWQPGLSGLLDTVMSSSVTALSFDSLTPGSNVCLSGIAIGLVTVG